MARANPTRNASRGEPRKTVWALFSPKGTRIDGLLEQLRCRAYILDLETPQKTNGEYDVVYAGASDMWWDEQHTVTEKRRGKLRRVFVDENGEEFTEDTLTARKVGA